MDLSPASRWVMSTVARPAVSVEQVGGDGVGRLRVEVLGRLVEHEDREVGQQCPGHGQPLALAARELRAALAHLGVEARRAGGASHSSSPTRSSTARSSSSLCVAPRRCGGSRPGWCRRGARPGRRARRRGARRRRPGRRARRPSRVDRPGLVGQEAQQDGGQGRLARAARARRWPTRRPGGEVEVDAVERRRRSRPGSAARTPASHQVVGRGGQRRPGRPGRSPATGASTTAKTRAAAAARPAAGPGWRPAGRPRARRRPGG